MVNEVEKSQVKEAAVWGIGPTFSYFQPSKHVTVFSNEELVDNRQVCTVFSLIKDLTCCYLLYLFFVAFYRSFF